MKFYKLSCMALLYMFIFFSGCSHTLQPTPQITDEVYVTVTPEVTEPTPTVTERNSLSRVPERLNSCFNYTVNLADEKKYTKTPKDFQNENEFYDYVFDYSENQIRDIVKYISDSDFMIINVDTLFDEPFNQTFVINNKSVVDELKEIISHLEFQKCSTYRYAEHWPDEISPPAGGGGGSLRELGLYADGERIYIYYEVDSSTGKAIEPQASSEEKILLRKGLMLFNNGDVIFNFGTGTSYSTISAEMRVYDREKFNTLYSQITKSITENYNGISMDEVILNINGG